MAFNRQNNGPTSFRWVLTALLLAVSVALVTGYAREGEGGLLHAAQNVASDIAAPFEFAGSAASSGVGAAGRAASDATADEGTLSALREANAELRQMLAQADEYRLEAQRLQQLVGLADEYGIDGVAARVVGKSATAWSQTVTIDVGEADGVGTGMTVMGSTGVIGQVVRTSSATSEVRLLTDPQSGAAARVQASRDEGIVRGSLEGLLYLENLAEDAVVQPGDVVVTSGLGGSYTGGLLIGMVVRVERGQDGTIGRVVVSPNDEAVSLEEVIVVRGVDSAGAGSDDAAGGGAAGAGDGEDGEGGVAS